jgi:regulator of protease activity HflC (stomatin/prohibitin superfamily)
MLRVASTKVASRVISSRGPACCASASSLFLSGTSAGSQQQTTTKQSWRPFFSGGSDGQYPSNVPPSFIRNKHRLNLPTNTAVKIVPQQEAWLIERFGKFNRILDSGLHFLIPVVDSIRYVHNLKEQTLDIPNQNAITRDNVAVTIDGILYVRVVDPYKASYGIEDPLYAVLQLAQTTMRSEIGKITLDKTFEEREALNHKIVRSINEASSAWGLECLRYEIRDIAPPYGVKAAMELQAEAERRKRATVLESEGDKQSAINKAEGEKQSKILASEAHAREMINKAGGEAESILQLAKATAEGIRTVGKSVGEKGAEGAIKLKIAEQYIDAFSNIAKESNTVVLPQNLNDANSMVAQAMAIYNGFNRNNQVNLSNTQHLPEDQSILNLGGGSDNGHEGDSDDDEEGDGPNDSGPKPSFSLDQK